jgi:DNA-binding MarR family transcriptional regulator
MKREASGLIERREDPDYRRRYALHLTERGARDARFDRLRFS